MARHGVSEVGQRYDAPQGTARGYQVAPPPRASGCCADGWRPRRSTPTCSIDEAQDFSPMQWRMLGRRGRWSSWTVVGDAAQASWPDAVEARQAREEAFGERSSARCSTWTPTTATPARSSTTRAEVIRAEVPDADIPQAVRETDVEPRDVDRCPPPSSRRR